MLTFVRRGATFALPLLALTLPVTAAAARGHKSAESSGSEFTPAELRAVPASVPSDNAPHRRYGAVPDPAQGSVFQLPTARLGMRGDWLTQGAGALGWAGLRVGVDRRLELGLGMPYFVAGVAAEVRLALYQGRTVQLALWALGTLPFLPGSNANDLLGFTWRGAGPSWLVGPLLSVEAGALSVHFGAHLAQRSLLGGVWTLVHGSVTYGLARGVRLLAQLAALAELASEGSINPGSHVLLGTGAQRWGLFSVGGVRLHNRQLSVDLGVLAVGGEGAPFAWSGRWGVWPWVSLTQRLL